MKISLKLALVLIAAFLCGQVSFAQSYPTRTIKIVNPYAAGGTDEFFAQTVAKSLSQQLGQRVIVQPHPGAGGNIGSNIVAKSPADGYTLLAGTSGSNAVNPSLYKNIQYNARKDLRLIATLATTENVLVVSTSSPFKSVKQVIAYAKAHPGKLTFASSGVGSVLQLSAVMLEHIAGIRMVHVPYKGTAPALIDVIGGRVNMMFANAPSVVNLVKSGKLRALAVSGSHRAAVLPDVPTMEQAGVPNFDLVSWFGIMAPYHTPASVVTKLNKDIDHMLRNPTVRQSFAKHGAKPLVLSAKRSEEFFLKQLNIWSNVVKISGVQIN